jgi:flagellar motility protein MotE (MotC chaperone)
MLATQDEEILSRVPDYKINLVSPWQMEDADFGKFRTALAETFQYIKYSKEDEALENAVNANPNFRSLDRRTAELINEVTGSRLEYEKKKEVVDVCKAIEDMKKKAVEAALKGVEEEKAATLKKVIEESKTKSIEQMLSKGRTPEAIADFCGYDLEEVRKVAENMSSLA